MKRRNPLGTNGPLAFNGTMDPQPPPNAPAAREAMVSRRRYRRIWFYGGVCCFLLLFAGMSGFPRESAASRGSKYPRAEGISHSREVHGALIEFDVQYGTFPNASTISKVRNDTATLLDLGTKSSNDYLRQILALGFGNEKMFGIRSRRFSMLDNRCDGAEALKRGE